MWCWLHNNLICILVSLNIPLALFYDWNLLGNFRHLLTVDIYCNAYSHCG